MVERSLAVLTLFAVLAAPHASFAAGQGNLEPRAATDADNSRRFLTTLCALHKTEPACADVAALSGDQAWLIVHAACREDNSDLCKEFRQQQGGVLEYDIGANAWLAHWEGRSWPLRFDVTGAPTLRLKPAAASQLKIVVTNISPLTYSATPGTPKEEDLAIIAGLKSFLALAGTGIQSLVRTVSVSTAAGLSFEEMLGNSARFHVTGPEPQPSRPRPAACAFPPPKVETTATLITHRHGLLVDLSDRAAALEAQLDAVAAAKTSYVRVVQEAEDGKPVQATQLKAPDLPALQSAYAALDGAVARLTTETAELTSCQPALSAYLTLLDAPPEPVIVGDLVKQVEIAGCRLPELKKTLVDNARLLLTDCPDKLGSALDLHQKAMKPLVDRLLDARKAESTVWSAIAKVQDGQAQVLAGVRTLTREVEKGLRHTWNATLLRELVVTRPNPHLPWSKIQTHAIEVKADSPYQKELTLAHDTAEKHEYKLESATGQILGYGIGMIYTPLQESTWTAVTVPGTTTKVIAETKRETRAGDLAAFLSYRFLEHRPTKDGHRRTIQPTMDFGVGLTSDRPAFFLGLGAELFRAARLGVGWTPQRVTMLEAGQQANVTVVSSTDEIKTRKAFDTSHYYVSFTFALDSLSLFNKP
jgi:hypothetical protein